MKVAHIDNIERKYKKSENITYKKKFSNDDIADNILLPDKYPLHKEFLGHKVGENVSFRGKEYEIIGIV